jgi:hypothetical protein
LVLLVAVSHTPAALLALLLLLLLLVVVLVGPHRGWTPWQEETLDPGAQVVGDTKEGFYFGRWGQGQHCWVLQGQERRITIQACTCC